jgi:hypothetical protein
MRVWCGPAPNGEDTPHDVLVDGNAEGQGDLLSNPGATPRRIPLFHVDDRGHDFLSGSLWTGLRRYRGGEEPPIFRCVSARCRLKSVEGLRMIANGSTGAGA